MNKKRDELIPGDTFFYDSEYFVATVGGMSFSITNNDVRFIPGPRNVEKVRGMIKITHAGEESTVDTDQLDG